ncbi:MAG: two-component system, cell cycle response regulator [Gaiellales bacterium]|nr:two-component system, cell cycle response regulator [Gaiellales bacterium]
MTRRFRQDERDRRELEVLHRLAVELPRSLSVIGVTDALARELVEAVDRACECTISSWEPEHDRLVALSVFERGTGISETWRGIVYPLTDWPESRLLLESANAHREYRPDDPGWSDEVRAQIAEWGWSSWVGLPLVVENHSVGLIELVDYASASRWSPRDVAFAQTIASQAAMAVRNAQLYENLRTQVLTDALTGLLNHRTFYERVEAEMATAQELGRDLSVIAIDLDDFKSVNDRDGHLAGDRLLRRVAEVLRGQCRESDAAGRVGGDEFLLALPGLGAEVSAVAQRIIKQTAAETGARASAGAACMRSGELDAASLIDRADAALLAAKRAGKSTFRLAA